MTNKGGYTEPLNKHMICAPPIDTRQTCEMNGEVCSYQKPLMVQRTSSPAAFTWLKARHG
jgi:hypothetical protein